MGLFNAGVVTWPSGSADSKQTNYQRRAYGSVTCTGNSKFGCSGGKTLSFYSGADPKVKRTIGEGGRYAPVSHLTSLTTKNHGGGDMSEASLWEIEFQYNVYDKGELDSLATSFMIPGSLLTINLGWNTGGSWSVTNAEVFDFSWSYNVDDGSWTCTCKALGSNAGSAGGIFIDTLNTPVEIQDADGTVRTGFTLFAGLDILAQDAIGVNRGRDGKLTGAGLPSKDGSAKQMGQYGIINAFVESGFFSDISEYQTVTTLSNVMHFINKSISKSGITFKWESDKYHALPGIISADPLKVCLPGEGAAYNPTVTENKNNFSGLGGSLGTISDIWVSTLLLKQVEESLLDKKSDKTEKGVYTANAYLSKLFGEISNMTGGLVNVEIWSDPYDRSVYKLVNKNYDVKYNKGGQLNLRSTNTPVRSVNMSSNLDPDMMAVAFSGRGGQYPESFGKSIFAGCAPTVDTTTTGDPADRVKELKQQLGDKYDPSTCTDLTTVLKEFVNKNLSNKGVFIRYNIDLSVTVDGFNPKFGQSFTVSPIPASVGTGNISFIVGEIEHKCDGSMWETAIVGYMMVKT